MEKDTREAFNEFQIILDVKLNEEENHANLLDSMPTSNTIQPLGQSDRLTRNDTKEETNELFMEIVRASKPTKPKVMTSIRWGMSQFARIRQLLELAKKVNEGSAPRSGNIFELREQQLGQSDELPRNGEEKEIDELTMEIVHTRISCPSRVPEPTPINRLRCWRERMEWKLRTWRELNGKLEHEEKVNKENVLPIFSKDLVNTPLEGKALNWKTFLRFTCRSACNIPLTHHIILLFCCGSFLSYQSKNLTTPFDIQLGNSSNNTPQSLQLSLGEAFAAFFPEMVHITKFMLCYVLTLMLVWPLEPGLQIFCMLFLICAPLFYFPPLVRYASGINVSCGSFHMPLIWFTTFGALGLSLICGFFTLLFSYVSWRYVYKGKSRGKEHEVCLDGLFEILDC